MGFFHPVYIYISSFYFSPHVVLGEVLKASKLRGSIKKKRWCTSVVARVYPTVDVRFCPPQKIVLWFPRTD